MQLVKNAQQQGLRCIIDSSGDALAAALDVGNIELVKPNQKELSALVQRDLSQPDDVRLAAQSLIQSVKCAGWWSPGSAGGIRRGRQRQRSGSAATDEKPEHRRRWRQHGGRHDLASGGKRQP